MVGASIGVGVGRYRDQRVDIDNMLSVRLVTAEGKLIDVSEDSNPDLWWAIRGVGVNSTVGEVSSCYPKHFVCALTPGTVATSRELGLYISSEDEARRFIVPLLDLNPTAEVISMVSCNSLTNTAAFKLGLGICEDVDIKGYRAHFRSLSSSTYQTVFQKMSDFYAHIYTLIILTARAVVSRWKCSRLQPLNGWLAMPHLYA